MTIGRYIGVLRWVALTIFLLVAAQLTLLAFPRMLFSQSTRVGRVRLSHNGLGEERADRLAREIDRRLAGSGFYDSTREDPLFVFRDRDSYALYRRLTFSGIVPSGFNLPIFGNSYVCESVVSELGAASGGQPRFSIWDGNLAHISAHEIGHQYVADLIGSGRWRKLPHWKQEGLPEYIANIADIRADPSLTLPSRIEILQDDSRWTATPPGRRRGWDRTHYEAWLLVEFLLDVRGLSVEQIAADEAPRSEVYAAMISWAGGQVGWSPARTTRSGASRQEALLGSDSPEGLGFIISQAFVILRKTQAFR